MHKSEKTSVKKRKAKNSIKQWYFTCPRCGKATTVVTELLAVPCGGKWISVKKRLPKMEHGFAMRQESKCVLIACNDTVHVAHLCEKWCDRTQRIFEACDCDCRGHDMEQDEWELDKVSHWMPLPEAPKGEG